ncbi:MAG: ABC transporter ATP-binding protein [Dehalococcoidales bacterium]|nr:ABC transporter ATP-binding protein [Dehalococcoidales bacterium]
MINCPTEIAIEVKNVSYNFNKIKAVDGLSLDIPAGISFGLLGPNGAGKTTLIRLIVGLLKPKSGNISLLGHSISRKTSHLIGYMPQLHSLYLELSVMDNLNFFASIYGLNNSKKRNQRVEEVIKLVDLWERRKDPVQNLSGGMRQRVSLACAIVHNPPLLLLDEPTVGLDPELRVTFWKYFASLNEQGTTIIISSHTMDDAAHCNQLAFIRQGKVIAQGIPLEIKQATGKTDSTLEDAFLYFIHREDKIDG